MSGELVEGQNLAGGVRGGGHQGHGWWLHLGKMCRGGISLQERIWLARGLEKEWEEVEPLF